jgi:hypothetical protein
VNEHIFAAIVALDEAKAFHVVEKLHGAIGTFAGRFAHWRPTIAAAEAAAISTAEATAVAATIKTASVRAGCTLRHGHRIALNDQIGRRHFAATIDQGKFKRLTLGKARKPRLLDCTDVDKNIIRLIIALDETEAFLSIEKLNDALAVADNLRGHCGRARCTAPKSAATAKTATAGGTETSAASAATWAAKTAAA